MQYKICRLKNKLFIAPSCILCCQCSVVSIGHRMQLYPLIYKRSVCTASSTTGVIIRQPKFRRLLQKFTSIAHKLYEKERFQIVSIHFLLLLVWSKLSLFISLWLLFIKPRGCAHFSQVHSCFIFSQCSDLSFRFFRELCWSTSTFFILHISSWENPFFTVFL